MRWVPASSVGLVVAVCCLFCRDARKTAASRSTSTSKCRTTKIGRRCGSAGFVPRESRRASRPPSQLRQHDGLRWQDRVEQESLRPQRRALAESWPWRFMVTKALVTRNLKNLFALLSWVPHTEKHLFSFESDLTRTREATTGISTIFHHSS